MRIEVIGCDSLYDVECNYEELDIEQTGEGYFLINGMLGFNVKGGMFEDIKVSIMDDIEVYTSIRPIIIKYPLGSTNVIQTKHSKETTQFLNSLIDLDKNTLVEDLEIGQVLLGNFLENTRVLLKITL